jgi:hypothetical protein
MNCKQCTYLKIIDGDFICTRRRNDNILIILDKNKLDIPCHASEPITYELENEYITPDKEKDLGYLEDDYDIKSEKILHKIVEVYK